MDKFAQKLNNLADYLYSTGFGIEAGGVLRIKKNAAGVGATACGITRKCKDWTAPCGGEMTGTILFDQENITDALVTIEGQRELGSSSWTFQRTITGTSNVLNEISDLQDRMCELINGEAFRGLYGKGQLFEYLDDDQLNQQITIKESYAVQDIKKVYDTYFDLAREYAATTPNPTHSHFRPAYDALRAELIKRNSYFNRYSEDYILKLLDLAAKGYAGMDTPDEDYGRNIIVEGVRSNTGEVERHGIELPYRYQFKIKGTLGRDFCMLDTQTEYVLSQEDFVKTCFDKAMATSSDEWRSETKLYGDTYTAYERGSRLLEREEGAQPVDSRREWQRIQELREGAVMRDYSITRTNPPERFYTNDAHKIVINVEPRLDPGCFATIFYSDRKTTSSAVFDALGDGNYSASLNLNNININDRTETAKRIDYWITVTCGVGQPKLRVPLSEEQNYYFWYDISRQ